MLKKPIFEIETVANNENLNLSNKQVLKIEIEKKEEDKLEKEDLKIIQSTAPNALEMKNCEAQTKQTSTDDNNKIQFQNISLTNFPNYIFVPYNFVNPSIFFNYQQEEKKEQKREEKKEQKRGRKTERTDINNPHNKFADDNLRKKSKHIILTEILHFLNAKLKEIYKNELGNGILLKQLLTLNHKQKANILVEENKKFLNKTLQEIFSDDISNRYTNFPKEHNKNLINNLLNEEEEEENREYFNILFNYKFSEVLQHFQGKKIIKELIGMKTLKESIRSYENDKDYYENLLYHLSKFEEIVNSKKPRKRNKKEEKIQ